MYSCTARKGILLPGNQSFRRLYVRRAPQCIPPALCTKRRQYRGSRGSPQSVHQSPPAQRTPVSGRGMFTTSAPSGTAKTKLFEYSEVYFNLVQPILHRLIYFKFLQCQSLILYRQLQSELILVKIPRRSIFLVFLFSPPDFSTLILSIPNFSYRLIYLFRPHVNQLESLIHGISDFFSPILYQ